jgi:hypothetical protein
MQKVSGKEKLFGNSPFDDRTQTILSNAKVPVGIFVEKKVENFNQIITLLYGETDLTLIKYVKRFIKNSEAQVTVADLTDLIKRNTEIKEAFRAIEQEAPNHITWNIESTIDEQFIQNFQLLVISASGWKKLVDSRCSWLNQTPSILILRD